jgi:hypothetical protein
MDRKMKMERVKQIQNCCGKIDREMDNELEYTDESAKASDTDARRLAERELPE